MTVINDAELAARVNGARPMIREMPTKVAEMFASQPDGMYSPVQPCSIDLHVGEIYLQTDADKNLPPRKEFDLPPGHSAVVTTHEVLEMPADLGAVAFPLGGRGQRGVLMMNPGHIDPGYEGKLWFSLINLSRENFRISQGDRVATVLFWRTSGLPNAEWKSRCGPQLHTKPPEDVVKTIAGDALMLESRAEQKAMEVVERQTQKIREDIGEEKKKVLFWGVILGGVLPIVVTGILNLLITTFGTISTVRDDTTKLKADLEKQAVQFEAALGRDVTTLKAKVQSHDDALSSQKVFLDGKGSQLNATMDRVDQTLAQQEHSLDEMRKEVAMQKMKISELESELKKKGPTARP
ncbi:MAG: hypothetical protein WD490_04515 [Opitutales bacterium]